MIISRTPFRISFFGGGTDYPAWYRKHGGAVLAATIDKYCYLTCRYLPPFFEHRHRIMYSKIEMCQKLDEIVHPSVREVLRYMKIDRGIEIHHDGDLPARSGMGSSSAFTVGLLHGLYALQGKMPNKYQLAMESVYIEQDILKETVGSQDQVSAAYGGLNNIAFLQNGEIVVRPLTLSKARVDELNDHLLLFYTGIQRTASEVAGSYVADMEARSRQLRILGQMVDESIALLNSGDNLMRFGELLREAWEAKRSLGARVSNPEVEQIYGAALAAGAVGGKLTGAGGGGFMLLFVPPSRHQAVKDSLKTLIHVPFRFEHFGSQIIFFDRECDYAAEDRARDGKKIGTFHELPPEPSKG